MSAKATLHPKAGHPWDQSPGYTLLTLDAKTKDELKIAIDKAKERSWELWINGIDPETNLPSAIMYRAERR